MSRPAQKFLAVFAVLSVALVGFGVWVLTCSYRAARRHRVPETGFSSPTRGPALGRHAWSWSPLPTPTPAEPEEAAERDDEPRVPPALAATPHVGGVVVDEEDRPVEGATVFVLGEGLALGDGVPALTGKNGRFVILDASLAKFATVEVRHNDYARASVVAFRDQPNLVVRLRRALTLSGRADSGHDGCEATLSYASGGRSGLAGEVAVGADGAFTFPKVEPSADYVVRVECPDAFGAGKLVSVGARSVQGVVVPLRPGVEVRGRCVDAAGAPVGGRRVVYWSPRYAESVTGADGSFRFPAPKVGVGAARFMVGNGVSYEVNNFGLFESRPGQAGVVDLGAVRCDGDPRAVAVYSPDELAPAAADDFRKVVEGDGG